MQDLNLMLHCGSSAATLEQVKNVATPAASDTHFPIPHTEIIDLAQTNLRSRGFEVQQAAYGLSEDGMQMFGLCQIFSTADDHSSVVGFRNSHDKAFSAGMVLGTGVFVCDNLCFSGEAKFGRKHTRNIMRELPGRVENCINELMDVQKLQDNRIECYKEAEMGDLQVHDILIQAMDEKVISSSQIPKVLEQWRTPNHPEFQDRNAWSLQNAFTEVFKGIGQRGSVWNLSNRSLGMHKVLDVMTDLPGFLTIKAHERTLTTWGDNEPKTQAQQPELALS